MKCFSKEWVQENVINFPHPILLYCKHNLHFKNMTSSFKKGLILQVLKQLVQEMEFK